MKKLLYALIIPLLFISKVHADTFTATNFYDNFTELETAYTTYSTNIDYLKNYWQTNLSNDYPFYIIIPHLNTLDPTFSNITLYATNDNTFSVQPYGGNDYDLEPNNVPFEAVNNPTGYTGILYNTHYDTYTILPNSSISSPVPIFYSSLNNVLSSSDFTFTTNTYDRIIIPSYTQGAYDFPQFEITEGQLYPTFETLYNNSYNPTPNAVYTEVDLSSYDYIVLSLKNYNQQPFTTDIYTLGELCFTPVYNFGMTQKFNIITGYKTPACSTSYSSYTPVRIYIISSDLENNAVYYIKKSANSSTNKVKIDTNVFDISYFQPNTTNPQATINGRSYPIIPYADLTDTASISTSTGYISGQVCAVGDVNCVAEVSGIDINNLFTHPLQLLQSVWGAIIGVFSVIGSFISILPPTLQAFLYTSFILGLVIGVIKIIL